MEQMSAREIQKALAQPFAPEDLEWRLQRTLEERSCGLAVPYVTNRAIQNRLDDVVGPDNWYNEFRQWHSGGKKEAQICGISIYFEGRGFVTKWDGAENTDIEPVKGGLSDSMKRAAVQFGIGRVLYDMEPVWVDIEKKGKTWYIKSGERQKLNRAYMDLLDRLHLLPAKPGGTAAQLTPKTTTENQKGKGQQLPAVPQNGNSAPQTSQGSSPEPAMPQNVPAAAKQNPPAPQPAISAPPASVSGPTPSPTLQQTPPPSVFQPSYEYVVLSAKIQGGMSGSSTLVELEALDGKRIQAFARGARPELTAGTPITNVKLSVRQQDTVAFYVLETYQIADGQQNAA